MKSVDLSTGLRLIVTLFESARFDYMIVGSIAGTIYGEPRLTKDLDVVVAVSSGASSTFSKIFQQGEFYIPPAEILSQEMVRSGQVNLLHYQSGLKVDIMFRKTNEHAVVEFTRRRRIEILSGLVAWVAAPEDVIVGKLRFYREGQSTKHLVDIRGILANTEIDQEYLREWTIKLGLEKYFSEI